MGTFDSITTGRLLLRRWQESDREPFAELNGDPQTLVYFPLNEPSQAVMRRLDMTEVARFDHPRVPDGHLVKPHVTYHLAAGCRLESGQSRLKSVSADGDPPIPA